MTSPSEINAFAKFADKFGFWKTLILLLCTITIPSYFFYRQGKQNCDVNINKNQVTNILGETSPENAPTNDTAIGIEKCEEKLFEENTAEWEIEQYDKPTKGGFYCPKTGWGASYPSPDIWYKEKIPVVFDSIKFDYVIKSKDEDSKDTPSFIFSLGHETRILRFYAPEEEPHLVGFQKLSIENPGQMERDESKRELVEPMQYGTEVNLNARVMIEKGNEVKYVFNIKYISAITGEAVEDSLTYNVNLVDPDPKDNPSLAKFGFATLQGNCIKPLKYQICYSKPPNN